MVVPEVLFRGSLYVLLQISSGSLGLDRRLTLSLIVQEEDTKVPQLIPDAPRTLLMPTQCRLPVFLKLIALVSFQEGMAQKS
jgi:hypothetical protein